MPYLVEKLDLDERRALVREVEPDYYTQPVASTSISPVEVLDTTRHPYLEACLGEVRIVERITGFKKIRFGSHENLGYGEVDLPETVMEAFAVWIELTVEGAERAARSLGADHTRAAASPAWIHEGLEGLGSLVRHIAALGLMCDPHDLIPALGLDPDAGEASRPAIYVHEAHPGGVGLVEKLYARIEEFGADALDALERCPCVHGCPSCCGPPDREGGLRKQAARAILGFMVGRVH
jgi:DEAD/DEAH box helicase domain-containing protein